ncbi:MAG TPA: outer membrane beta-barrel protein [Gammaproteobacteria bacterium]
MRMWVCGLLLWGMSFAASAGNLGYDYLDLAYSKQSNDYGFSGGDGYRLGGDWDIGGGFLVEGSYQHNRFEQTIGIVIPPFQPELTLDDYRLGVGYRLPLGERVELVSLLGYGANSTKYERPGISVTQSDHTPWLAVGVRAEVADALEVDAALEHDNSALEFKRAPSGVIYMRQDARENVISLAARYHSAGPFSAGLEYRHGNQNGSREWLASARWDF